MTPSPEPFLDKALASLPGAESEFAAGRYDNCAYRPYYACFRAAIAALQRAGIRPEGVRGQWGHAFGPAQFKGVLIKRRHLYPTELRNILEQTYAQRRKADYDEKRASRTDAERSLRRARRFVKAIEEGGS